MVKEPMMNWWGMSFGPVGMIILAAVVALFAIAVMRILLKPSPTLERISPIEILEERYARGEIDETQFRQSKKELGL